MSVGVFLETVTEWVQLTLNEGIMDQPTDNGSE